MGDLELIKESAFAGAEYALNSQSGVAGLDQDKGDKMSIIEFPRIKGGKPFDIDLPWFGDLLGGIDQPKGSKVEASIPPDTRILPSSGSITSLLLVSALSNSSCVNAKVYAPL